LRTTDWLTLLDNPAIPKSGRFPDVVASTQSLLGKANMEANLKKFTSFHTRYYLSKTGEQSAEWLFSQVEAIAEESGKNISVTKFTHAWSQFSIIARLEGQGEGATAEETVILGAHQDSINRKCSCRPFVLRCSLWIDAICWF
jgi:leucyl aminopeptidase